MLGSTPGCDVEKNRNASPETEALVEDGRAKVSDIQWPK